MALVLKDVGRMGCVKGVGWRMRGVEGVWRRMRDVEGVGRSVRRGVTVLVGVGKLKGVALDLLGVGRGVALGAAKREGARELETLLCSSQPMGW